MIVTLQSSSSPDRVKAALVERGLWVQRLDGIAMDGSTSVQFLVQGHSQPIDAEALLELEGVASVAMPGSSHPELDGRPSTVQVGPHHIGPEAPFAVIAGPCSLDSEDRIRMLAERVSQAGARFLRGGAFKPRTSPYAFQGKGEEALRWMRRAASDFGLAVVTECLSELDVELVAEYADMVQVGSRNMHNYALLKSVARAGRPVLLKRGMAATVEEWLLAGEYLAVHGCPGVVFCERGVRGFDSAMRNLLDLAAVAHLAVVHGVPVVVDPSHATGRRDLIAPLARAARAVGAHGVMFETHDDPGRALSDGPQALPVDRAQALVRELQSGGAR